MFRKLVSRLPFQPNLLGDLVHYQKQLGHELSLRRTGIWLAAALLLLQVVFTATQQHASVSQASTGDIVFGAQSREDIIQAYIRGSDMAGRDDIRQIFEHFGISDGQLATADMTSLDVSRNGRLYAVSRMPISSASGFIGINAVLGGGVYELPVSAWLSGKQPALSGMTSYGYRFWVLLQGSGSIVYERQTAENVRLQVDDIRLSQENASDDDEVTFQIRYRNNGKTPAVGTSISYSLSDNLRFKKYESSSDLVFATTGSELSWRPATTNSTLAPSQAWGSIDVKATINKLSNKQQLTICNTLKIESIGISAVYSDGGIDQRCVSVTPRFCPGTGVPVVNGDPSSCAVQCQDGTTLSYSEKCAIPLVACRDIAIVRGETWDQKVITATVMAQPGAQAKRIDYYAQGRLLGSTGPNNPTIRTTLAEGNHIVTAHVENADPAAADAGDCSTSVTVAAPKKTQGPMLTKHVVASTNSHQTSPGDTVTYTIRVTNISADTAVSLPLSGEYGVSLVDVLEYGTLQDTGTAQYDSRTATLSWSAVALQPGEYIERVFSIRLHSPLPSNPTPPSDSRSYDGRLSVVYGNDLTVTLPKSIPKTMEQALGHLSVIAAPVLFASTVIFILCMVALFIRVRLYSAEIETIHDSFTGGNL